MSCQTASKLNPGEGTVKVTGGKVWYRIAGQGDKTPLLLLHGGPGVPSYYLNPLSALGDERPVIFYDQAGCGRSGNALDTSYMNVDSFVTQLEELRIALGLQDFYLYGSSWGTMLGIEYYLKYPQHVKAILFSSPCLSARRWSEDALVLIATLPEVTREIIRKNVEAGTYSNPEFQEAMGVYYSNFVTRTSTPDIDSSLAGMNGELYQYMWGPSEFTPTGVLKDFDRTGSLGKISVPVLFLAGEFDEARPSTVEYYHSLVPGSVFRIMKDAGHMTMQDHPEQDVGAIRQFLKSFEEN